MFFDQLMRVQNKKEYWCFPLQLVGELKTHTQHNFAALNAEINERCVFGGNWCKLIDDNNKKVAGILSCEPGKFELLL